LLTLQCTDAAGWLGERKDICFVESHSPTTPRRFTNKKQK